MKSKFIVGLLLLTGVLFGNQVFSSSSGHDITKTEFNDLHFSCDSVDFILYTATPDTCVFYVSNEFSGISSYEFSDNSSKLKSFNEEGHFRLCFRSNFSLERKKYFGSMNRFIQHDHYSYIYNLKVSNSHKRFFVSNRIRNLSC